MAREAPGVEDGITAAEGHNAADRADRTADRIADEDIALIMITRARGDVTLEQEEELIGRD